jgi:hypothetical protein
VNRELVDEVVLVLDELVCVVSEIVGGATVVELFVGAEAVEGIEVDIGGAIVEFDAEVCGYFKEEDVVKLDSVGELAVDGEGAVVGEVDTEVAEEKKEEDVQDENCFEVKSVEELKVDVGETIVVVEFVREVKLESVEELEVDVEEVEEIEEVTEVAEEEEVVEEENVKEELDRVTAVGRVVEVEVVAEVAGSIVELEVDVGGTIMDVEEAGGPSPN